MQLTQRVLDIPRNVMNEYATLGLPGCLEIPSIVNEDNIRTTFVVLAFRPTRNDRAVPFRCGCDAAICRGPRRPRPKMTPARGGRIVRDHIHGIVSAKSTRLVHVVKFRRDQAVVVAVVGGCGGQFALAPGEFFRPGRFGAVGRDTRQNVGTERSQGPPEFPSSRTPGQSFEEGIGLLHPVPQHTPRQGVNILRRPGDEQVVLAIVKHLRHAVRKVGEDAIQITVHLKVW